MKILLMDFWRVVNSTGGTEKVLCRMADRWLGCGQDQVTVVCNDLQNGRPFFPLSERVCFYNLGTLPQGQTSSWSHLLQREIYRAFGRQRDERYVKCSFSSAQIREFQRILREAAPEVIISFDPDSLLFLKAVLHNTLPTIAMLHMQASYYFNKNTSKILLRAYDQCRMLQVLNKSDMAVAAKYLPQLPLCHIPNAVPNFGSTVNLAAKKNRYQVLHIGRLAPDQKRQLLLVQAFANLCPKYPEWQLCLWGGASTADETVYRDRIAAFIRQHHLSDRIFLKGEYKQVEKILSEADIFPLALTEAMSAGLPAVGYKHCPSVRELIRPGVNGFLCEEGLADFTQKLDLLMGDRSLRIKMGQQAHQDMRAYAPEKIWQQWQDLLNKVVRLPPGSAQENKKAGSL